MVYKDNPKTVEELEESIHLVVDSMDDDLLKRSIDSFITRCEQIILTNGERIIELDG